MVDRFGLSRFSSEISFESAGDNKSVSAASLEITLFSSVVENRCVVVVVILLDGGGPCDENVVNVVGFNLIGVADDDEYIEWFGDGVDGIVDENGDWVVRGRIVVDVVGFAACVL